MEIKEISTETLYREIWEKKVINVNGKEVRITHHDKQDMEMSNYESDTEMSKQDMDKLTDEEHDALDEYLEDVEWT